LLATQTLGEMYADKGGMDLIRKYPSTWTAWVNRQADVAVTVRLNCVEATPALITSLPEYRGTLAGQCLESTAVLSLSFVLRVTERENH
jgi:sister-chromatid-cohesion protein PDS5